MICPSCQQETEEGKFCTSCGAVLHTDESAAAVDPVIDPEPVEPATEAVQSELVLEPQELQEVQESKEPNEFVEKLKETSSGFGQFFLNLLKRPSDAKNVTSKDLISGIITIVIFSLIIALNTYFSARSTVSGITLFDINIGASVSFFDSFIVPFLKYIIMFGLLAVVTFGAIKVANQEGSITDVIAKYAAYLVPFLLLYIVGILFSLIKFGFPFTVFASISTVGPVLIIPLLILLEKRVKSFDLVYVILGLLIVSQIVSSSIMRFSF